MARLRRIRPARGAPLLAVLLAAASVVIAGGPAIAAPTPIGLGTATTFAIRAGDTVTNVPLSAITGDVGLAPGGGAAYVGLTCAQITGNTYETSIGGPAPCVQLNPGLMTTVENDARTAFNHTSLLPGATALSNPDLAGLNLVPGLYSFGAAATNLSGTLTLNAQADPNAVWIFQASSTLITSSGSTVQFSNLPAGVSAAQMACNVFWTSGNPSTAGSTTIASTTSFVGTILASASITVNAQATVVGRLLAANAAGAAGAVTMNMDTITAPTGCATLPPGTGGGPAAPPGRPAAPPPAAPAPPVGGPPRFTG